MGGVFPSCPTRGWRGQFFTGLLWSLASHLPSQGVLAVVCTFLWELSVFTDLEHGVSAYACHCLSARKPFQDVWWSSGNLHVFSGEAKEIYRCKIRILIIIWNVISNFCFSKRNTNFKFHSPPLKILFLKEDLQLFLPVRQALPRVLGTFREATSTETAQLLSYGPKLLEVMITKGTRQPRSSNFHLFLSVFAPSKIIHHAKTDFSGIWSKILLISGARLNCS